jgi:hypothetical protein
MRSERHCLEGHQNQDHNNQPCKRDSVLEVISRWLRVSATIFLGPLIYSIVGLNSSIMRCHHMTCLVLKFLWVRFWWSVWTTIHWPKRIFQNSFKVSTIERSSLSVVVYLTCASCSLWLVLNFWNQIIYNKYIIRRYTTSFGKSIAWSPAPADQ